MPNRCDKVFFVRVGGVQRDTPATSLKSEVSKRGWREGVGDKQTPKKVECPQMWVCAQVPLGGPSPTTCEPPPPRQPRSPIPEHCEKYQEGWGKRGTVGREGLWREGSSSCLGGGGCRPNGSWGQTHIWGLSKRAQKVIQKCVPILPKKKYRKEARISGF